MHIPAGGRGYNLHESEGRGTAYGVRVEVAFGLGLYIECRMKMAGFDKSEEWTADEDGPMHVTYISRSSEVLDEEDKRKHPCARIVR